jgi:hypothetical protein
MMASAKYRPPDSRSPQPAQLNAIAKPVNGLSGAGLSAGWGGVHQHPRVLEDEAPRGSEGDAGNDERGDGVSLRKPERNHDETCQDRHRAGHVAGKVKGV